MIVELAVCLCLAQEVEPSKATVVTKEQVREAGAVIGLEFTDDEIQLMLKGVGDHCRHYERLQQIALDNSVPPAIAFSPVIPGVDVRPQRVASKKTALPETRRPKDLEELAFATIPELASLIRARKVGCVELTQMYLSRLERLDKQLLCVVTFTRERALAQAEALDRELAQGKWRGLLHGIPYGAKDLLAVKGYRTTWGAKPFEDQVLDLDATVVRKLDEAGAVLIAKLTLGELAWGDVWFGGMTKNPWKLDEGSSGSSAGSASATAAGGVAFSIGSETLGSIVSPSARCGCSSLRPTFGRVSRHGAMALCWTMDKLGPICRTVEDASIVFGAIHGPDGLDPSVLDHPYEVPGDADVRGFKVGYDKAAFDRARGDDSSKRDLQVLDELRALGVELAPIELPSYPLEEMLLILGVEAATAFDELTRSGRDDLLVRQVELAWPNVLRTARLVPAVEYLRANRIRTQLMRDLHRALAGVDLYVHPTFGGPTLLMSNLTGHPTVIAPNGFRENGTPTTICFTGQLFGEAKLLALAQAWQKSTPYHQKHPDVNGSR